MFPGACPDAAVEMIEELGPLRGKKGEQSERPFLQRVIGKERTGNFVLMRIQHASAKPFRAAGFCAQATKLIEHFLGCRVERSNQRLVQLCERFAQTIDQGFDRLLAFVESRGERLRQRLRLEARAKFVASLKNIPRIQIIFLEQI